MALSAQSTPSTQDEALKQLIAQQQEQIAALTARLERLEAGSGDVVEGVILGALSAQPAMKRTSRRSLLKMGGVGAAAALAAAGSGALGHSVVQAANGDPLIAGHTTKAENGATLIYDGSEITPNIFTAQFDSNVNLGNTSGGSAISGIANNTADALVYGVIGKAGTGAFC